MKTALKYGVAGILLAVAGFVSPAQAVVSLSVGGTTITDGGAGDINPLTGAITYIGTVPGYTFSIVTGIGTAQPLLDLSSVQISSTAASTTPLVIRLTETGLTTPLGTQRWLSQLSGNTSGGSTTVQAQTYYDATNTAFGTGTALANLTSTTSNFGLSSTNSAGANTPYSLTEVLTITTGGTGRSLSLDASLVLVPEPASLALFGAGLLGAGMIRRRFSRS